MADDTRASQSNANLHSGLPRINFLTFLISLTHAAMVHLGEAGEDGGPVSINLPMAKQNIDILELLKVKTQGNLDSEEQRFLDNTLRDLRLEYIRKCKKEPSSN